MIVNPSQWQVSLVKPNKDEIVIKKKPFYVYLFDFINRYTPVYVVVPIMDKSGKIVGKKKVDNRFVVIFPENEKLSRVTKTVKVAHLDSLNKLTTYNDGVIAVAFDAVHICYNNEKVTVSLNELEFAIEKMKRKYNMIKDKSELPNYKLVSTQVFGEIEYDNVRYKFKNGIELQFLFYVSDKDEERKFYAVENLFKTHCCGETLEEAYSNLLKILVDRIKIALTESTDETFKDIMLDNSENEFLKMYLDVEEIKDKE